MKLLFQNASGDERVIAEINNEDEALKNIEDFCAEHNFIIPYIRMWMQEGRKYFDCGSWSEYFILEYDKE